MAQNRTHVRPQDPYKPFQDYLGFNGFTWNKDLVTNLTRLMTFSPSFHDDKSSDGKFFGNSFSRFRCVGSSANKGVGNFDPLDIIRRDSLEDFRHNGRDVELDELDSYQVELRRHSSISVQQESTNPVVLEVLAFKERKRAARRAKLKNLCVFCKNNGETSAIYTSHVLKDAEGRVCCPILRKYTCPLCGVSGDNAHTIRYCPKNECDISTPSLIQSKTRRVLCGKRRRSSDSENSNWWQQWTEHWLNIPYQKFWTVEGTRNIPPGDVLYSKRRSERTVNIPHGENFCIPNEEGLKGL